MPKRARRYFSCSFLNACGSGDVVYVSECIKEMSPKDIKNAFDNHKFGPIHHAVRGHSIECLRLLLAVNSLNVREKTYEGCTPLMVAVENECAIDIIRLLIEFDPELINVPNNEEVFPMHLAITNHRSLDIVKLMVETLKKNNLPLIDHIDLDGDSSILLAARANHFEILEYLIDHTTFDVKYTSKIHGLNAFSAIFLMQNANGLDPQRENAFRMLQKVFQLIYGDADKPLLVNEILSPMTLSMIFDNYQYTDWFIENFYLDEMNEHLKVAAICVEFIRSRKLSRKSYSMVFPLHSHLACDAFLRLKLELREFVWQQIYFNAIEVFQVDRNLFQQFYGIFSDKFECPSETFFISSFVDLIRQMAHDESTLTEFLVATRTFEAIGGGSQLRVQRNIDMCGDTETYTESPHSFSAGGSSKAAFLKRLCINGLEEKDVLPIYLAALMPFTTMTSADSIIDQCRTYRDDNIEWIPQGSLEKIRRFCSKRFHKEPLLLTMMCRIVIREAVFQPNAHETTDITGRIDVTRSERLMSLELPKKLLNFLRYNYTNYDLASK